MLFRVYVASFFSFLFFTGAQAEMEGENQLDFQRQAAEEYRKDHWAAIVAGAPFDFVEQMQAFGWQWDQAAKKYNLEPDRVAGQPLFFVEKNPPSDRKPYLLIVPINRTSGPGSLLLRFEDRDLEAFEEVGPLLRSEGLQPNILHSSSQFALTLGELLAVVQKYDLAPEEAFQFVERRRGVFEGCFGACLDDIELGQMSIQPESGNELSGHILVRLNEASVVSQITQALAPLWGAEPAKGVAYSSRVYRSADPEDQAILRRLTNINLRFRCREFLERLQKEPE